MNKTIKIILASTLALSLTACLTSNPNYPPLTKSEITNKTKTCKILESQYDSLGRNVNKYNKERHFRAMKLLEIKNENYFKYRPAGNRWITLLKPDLTKSDPTLEPYRKLAIEILGKSKTLNCPLIHRKI